jgi:SAM-dependent methyltransferase
MRLSQHLCELIPQGATVLDVGCGDGKIAALIRELRPDVEIQGIDVLVRENTAVPITEFDGSRIPFPDKTFDVVMFVDVLHHTDDPVVLLREAARAAKRFILIKDHTSEGFLAGATLRFMDCIGNKPHGIVLPYNYWRESQWKQSFRDLQFEVLDWKGDLKLYPYFADLIFGRNLHMVTKLKVG